MRMMATIKPSFTTKQINNALKKGGEIIFESGNYMLTDCLVLYSNTKVIARGATFFRKYKGRMLQLYVTPDTTKYNGVHDVEWHGGRFVANSSPENANVISLFHGKSIYMYDAYIQGCRGMHSVEINACKDIILIGSIISDQSAKDGEEFREAIQIDFANYDGLKVKGAKPNSHCYDGTHCDTIYIKQCSIQNCPNGIGTHTVSKCNKYHKNVIIEGCSVRTKHKDIKLYGFDGCSIRSVDCCDILVGAKNTAHLNSEGKVELSTPKRNKHIMIDDCGGARIEIE